MLFALSADTCLQRRIDTVWHMLAHVVLSPEGSLE